MILVIIGNSCKCFNVYSKTTTTKDGQVTKVNQKLQKLLKPLITLQIMMLQRMVALQVYTGLFLCDKTAYIETHTGDVLDFHIHDFHSFLFV